jgi:hypothetical protein
MAEIIEVKVVKNIDGQPPSASWSNTYHLELSPEMLAGDGFGVGIASGAFADAVNGIMQMETNLHVTNIRILRAVCTTVREDDKGAPESIRVVPWGKLAVRGPGPGDVALPLEVVLKVSFAGLTGRAGANQYRGALYSGDVNTTQNGYQLKAGIDNMLRDAVINGLNAEGARDYLRIVRRVGNVITARPVDSIVMIGVGLRQRTQKKRSAKIANPEAAKQAIKESGGILMDARNFLEKYLADVGDGVADATAVAIYNALVNRLRPLAPLPQLPEPPL